MYYYYYYYYSLVNICSCWKSTRMFHDQPAPLHYVLHTPHQSLLTLRMHKLQSLPQQALCTAVLLLRTIRYPSDYRMLKMKVGARKPFIRLSPGLYKKLLISPNWILWILILDVFVWVVVTPDLYNYFHNRSSWCNWLSVLYSIHRYPKKAVIPRREA